MGSRSWPWSWTGRWAPRTKVLSKGFRRRVWEPWPSVFVVEPRSLLRCCLYNHSKCCVFDSYKKYHLLGSKSTIDGDREGAVLARFLRASSNKSARPGISEQSEFELKSEEYSETSSVSSKRGFAGGLQKYQFLSEATYRPGYGS